MAVRARVTPLVLVGGMASARCTAGGFRALLLLLLAPCVRGSWGWYHLGFAGTEVRTTLAMLRCHRVCSSGLPSP